MENSLIENFKVETSYSLGGKYDVLFGEVNVDIFTIPNDSSPIMRRRDNGLIEARIECFDDLTNNGLITLRHFLENQQYYKNVISEYVLKWYIDEFRPKMKDWISEENWQEAQIDPYIELFNTDSNRIEEFICLSSIYILLQKTSGCFSLCFDTPWEYEHGIGIDFINFNIVDIGGCDSYVFNNHKEKNEIFKDQMRKGITKPTQLEYFSDFKGLGVRRYYRWDWELLEHVVYKETPIP